MTIARSPGRDPLTVVLDAARIAAEIALEGLSRPREIAQKERRADIVTDTDRASEAAILARLRASFPDATMVTEESGTHAGSSRERFIIDPIDGTTNFAHGYPIFCISIGYERDGELCVGVVHAPAMGEVFAAERGAGATRNGERINVSTISDVGGALVTTGFHPADYERNAPHFRRISNHAQAVRRDGSAALDLAYVACGRFDGFWEWDLHGWDVAAGTLLVREAGGTVTRIDGGFATIDGRSILASNGVVHDELGALLRSV